jgi:hypothetical protein
MRGGGRSRGRTGLFCRFPGNREKYREKIGGVTNPASVGGAVHAPKSSNLDEIAEQKSSEEQGISVA